MPKQTFFNLPEDKRKTLIQAAEKEFARVPLFEASIANIIKMVGIPRGSFYQYFENIEDLYFYLLEQKLRKCKFYFITLLKKHNGDFIETVTEMYHNFLVETPDEEEHNFLKNAMLYATHKLENSLMDVFVPTDDKKQLHKLTKLIDTQGLNVNEDQELLHILHIVSGVVFHNFINKSIRKLSDEEALNHFAIQMNLIKHGVLRKE